MTRRRSGWSQLRSGLYRSARLMGDAQAAAKGPGPYVRRRVRRRAYGATNGALARLLRSLGLGG